MTDLTSVRVITPDPIGVGTRAEGRVRILGISVDDPVEIVEFAPPHRFAIRHLGAFSGSGLITLDTLDGGRRTRIEWAETLVPPVLPNLGSLVQAPILGRIFQADLERLKALIEESRTPDPASGSDETLPVAAVSAPTNGHGTRAGD
jgi:hypothetical protein